MEFKLENTSYFIAGVEDGEPEMVDYATDYPVYRVTGVTNKQRAKLFEQYEPYSDKAINFTEDGEYVFSPYELSYIEIVTKLTNMLKARDWDLQMPDGHWCNKHWVDRVEMLDGTVQHELKCMCV